MAINREKVQRKAQKTADGWNTMKFREIGSDGLLIREKSIQDRDNIGEQ